MPLNQTNTSDHSMCGQIVRCFIAYVIYACCLISSGTRDKVCPRTHLERDFTAARVRKVLYRPPHVLILIYNGELVTGTEVERIIWVLLQV